MRTVKALRLAAAVAVALIAGIVIVSHVSAQLPVLRVTSATASPGASAEVDVEARDFGTPGLGAWEIGVVYDSSLLTAVSCAGQQGSVCNTTFASNRVQIVGANASGLQGTNVLASITFRCNGEGSSDLSIVIDELSDATIGGPSPIGPGINAGRVTCVESSGLPDVPSSPSSDDGDDAAAEVITTLPSSGQGTGRPNTVNWLIAAAASLGLVTIVSFGAARLFAQRRDA